MTRWGVHYELHETKKIFLIPVKIVDLWSYLKVFTGIKEEKLKKKIFQHGEKKISDLPISSLLNNNFFKKS